MTDQPLRPLSGVRVIGLEQYIAGPYCTMLLADAGAEVIKIERPGVGDPRRGIAPFAQRGNAKKAGGFMAYNRNKKSLALNLREEEGQKILRELAAASDVVVDNLRPGVTTKLGLDYPISYVRWTENRNLQAFLALAASGAVRPDQLDAAIVDV